ncbi:hypothetical protein IM697_02895 [Streptomyces ferrugineus]|uniref:Uncharacterized protein n=1 Tax=Streptomyces ferrugineus TaxID=1413221 RepID=A0A7M2SPJ9_9ACTN|nr:hypothetical protein [Streptomyces ferrugineus]QOV37403.1 hypothetical protein IM697_02895 [Streptomyces ferrugineus]
MPQQVEQVVHAATGVGPADLTLALAIAGALHAPTVPSRAPELVTARPRSGRRNAAARGRRRTVRG